MKYEPKKKLTYPIAVMAWASIFILNGLEVAGVIEISDRGAWYIGGCLILALLCGLMYASDA